jgi:hypothetical protein
MVILNEKRKYMSYNKFGVNTSNSFNTPPKAGNSKLFKQLIDMGYTNQTEAIIAINAYLLTGKIPNPTKKGNV